MRYTIVALVIACTAFIHVANAKEKPLKVFICAGQSNMVGSRSIESKLPNDLQSAQKNLFFDRNSWIALAPGKTEKKGFGPEISFAQKMCGQLNEPIGIIKHSVGGTDLAKRWSPKNKKSLYASLVKKVKEAQKSKNIEIVGMLWMQGERDSKSSDMANAYANNLNNFIKALRKDFNSPNMYFVVGRVNPPKGKFPFVEIVRKAQEECKEENYAFIDCDTLEKGNDNVHYSTKGIIAMGQKFAETMLELINKK